MKGQLANYGNVVWVNGIEFATLEDVVPQIVGIVQVVRPELLLVA